MRVDEYLPMFESSGEKYSVPPGLLRAMAIAESGGDPLAVRREPHINDESRGLMQILKRTAADYGLRDPDSMWEPAVSIEFGAKIVGSLYMRFWEIPESRVERWRFAVAAYNAGLGTINRALAKSRVRMGFHLSPSAAKDGRWQRWEWVVPFLPERTLRFTPRHVEKVTRLWAEWEAR